MLPLVSLTLEARRQERTDDMATFGKLAIELSARGGTQAELAELLGSRSRASELLNRRRPLTVEMIHKIGEAWKIPADLLVKPSRVAA